MGYTLFSTENANYIQVYDVHVTNTKNEILNKRSIKSLDAILLENSGADLGILEAKQLGIEFLPNLCGDIPKEAHDAGKAIYLADAGTAIAGNMASIVIKASALYFGLKLLQKSADDFAPKKEMGRRSFLKGIGKAAAGFFLLNSAAAILPAVADDNVEFDALETAAAAAHRLFPDPVIEVRNCILARKTEEFVAPLLKKRLGRSPNIAIVYGGFHFGLEGCIENKWWRDSVLGLYQRANYIGIELETLDKVWEILPAPKSGWANLPCGYETYNVAGLDWYARRYNCGLF